MLIRRSQQPKNNKPIHGIEIPFRPHKDLVKTAIHLPDHARLTRSAIREERRVDCLCQRNRHIIIRLISTRKTHPVQRKHPQRQVVVVLPVPIGPLGVDLPDSQAAAQRIIIACAGEARGPVARSAEDVMHGGYEARGEG
jgi:hypothetical protein